jgi:DNA-binding Lrp family transcriptional regulator
MRTISVGFDIVAINATSGDSLVFGLMSQWVSFLVTLSIVVVLSLKRGQKGKRQSLGYSLDPDFGCLSILPKKPMMYVLLAGVFAGISTFSYYIIIGISDVSSVLPYGQLVIIYLLVGDLFAEKDTPTIVEVHCVLSILLGVLLVGATPGGFDLAVLLIVLVPMNTSSALTTYYQRRAKRYELQPGLRVDSLNMRVWSLLILDLVYSVLSLPLMSELSWNAVATSFVPLMGFMIGSSLTTFLSIVMYVRALGRGSMAIVNSLSAISVVLGIPMALIGNLLVPGAFGVVSSDTFLWTLRIIGIVLVLIGVISLEASDVRSIMLVKVRPRTGDLLPDLYAIRGVESVSALAGRDDYLLSVRSRSLAKTRKLILKKIQNIEGVKTVQTLVVLKEFR